MARNGIDWLHGVEQPIRDTLRAYAQGRVVGVDALRMVDAILAESTGRGPTIPEPALEWEYEADPAERAEYMLSQLRDDGEVAS